MALAFSGKTDEGMRYLERAYEMNPSPENMSTLAQVAQRIVCDNPQSSNAMVWDLFASRESLTAEMSKLIDERVKEAAAT